jgi:hypothetical protein
MAELATAYRMAARGRCPMWVGAKPALPYTTIVNLKNGTLKTEEIRLLLCLAVPLDVIRVGPDHQTHRLLFPS